MNLASAIRRVVQRVPMWFSGNLLDEDILTEIHVLIPRDGRPRLFTPKSDHASEQFVHTVINSTVSAAMDFGRLYGVNVAGFLGQPACPHCGKIIAGPAGPPPP